MSKNSQLILHMVHSHLSFLQRRVVAITLTVFNDSRTHLEVLIVSRCLKASLVEHAFLTTRRAGFLAYAMKTHVSRTFAGSTLYATANRPPLLSVVGGLGGKDISDAEFDAVFARFTRRTAAGEHLVGPRLLYTQPEQERLQTLLRIAGKEVPA